MVFLRAPVYHVLSSLKQNFRNFQHSGVEKVIKCWLTEFGRAKRENVQCSVLTHRVRCARSVRHDLEPNNFSVQPSHSVNKYMLSSQKKDLSKLHFSTQLFKKLLSNVLLVHLRGLWRFHFIANSSLQPLQARPSLYQIAQACTRSPPNLWTRFLKAENIPFLSKS